MTAHTDSRAGLEGRDPEHPDELYHPDKSGYSLANVRELLFGCLEAAEATSIVEIGADQGYLTAELAAWADRRGGRVTAIDTMPSPRLQTLVDETPGLELVEAMSHDALTRLGRADAYIVDGDHNYHTVSRELELIEAAAGEGADWPLVIFHDVAWPHARRDTYYDPDNVPPGSRQPLAREARIVPWQHGLSEGGIHYAAAAEHEGGARNGVLTAIEDFLAPRPQLRFARVPAFFGFGALWYANAAWSERVAAVVEPLADHPVIERLEANRVALLAHKLVDHERFAPLAEENERLRQRLGELERVLEPMLNARAMRVAEMLARLRSRGTEPGISIERVRNALRGE